MLLDSITQPADVRALSLEQLEQLATEIRERIIAAVSANGGHLGSNLGVVELTLALHRVFDSPHDIILWDTGHQAYVHKMLTGRAEDRKSTRLNSSHSQISYAVFCLKKKKKNKKKILTKNIATED